MEKKEKEMGFSQAWKLQKRAMKIFQELDPWYLPSIALEKMVSAVIPFVLVFFSARILNELAGERRPDVLWKWVWTAVAVSGLMALLKALFTRFRSLREGIFYDKRSTLFVHKQFEMDYADAEKSATHELRAKIRQYNNFMGFGFDKVSGIFPVWQRPSPASLAP